jgi:arylsulfatase A-like enzyme
MMLRILPPPADPMGRSMQARARPWRAGTRPPAGFALLAAIASLAALCGCERRQEALPGECAPVRIAAGMSEAGAEQRAALLDRPPSALYSLVACAGAVRGTPPGGSEAFASWEGGAVSRWKVEPIDDGVRLTSPELQPELGEVNTLRLVLTPGGATSVAIIPLVRTQQKEERQREHRLFEIALERDAEPDEPVTLEVDLTEAVRGNWGDVTAGGPLERIEILLPFARAEKVRVLEASLLGAGALYEGAAAAARPVELDGLIRPSWYVHGGSSVRFRITLPAGVPELRWHDGGLLQAGDRVVRLLAGGESIELSRATGPGAWDHRRVSLQRWAGRRVTLELSTEGGGIGLFGEPRVLLPRAEPQPPGVILYMIDTLRADRLGAWGYGGPAASPFLDRLAKEGVMFGNAISSSCWTKPAIPTLMTGIWPTTHRVGATSYSDRLPAGVPLVQERFRDAGWRTGSFSASPLGSTLSGLERGFGTVAPPRRWRGKVGELGQVSAAQLHAEMLSWLMEEPDQPAFAYVHTLEVHEFHRGLYRPEGGRDRYAGYDRAVQDADRNLQRLVDDLREVTGRTSWLLVVVSDHGHSMDEHGQRGHGQSLFQSEIHIPLIFWAPGLLPPSRSDIPVGLPDVAPTLLDLAGLPAIPGIDGHSLAGVLRGTGAPPRSYVASALLRYIWKPEAPRQFALVSNDLGKIIRTSDEREFRFDLGSDPTEQHDLTGAHGAIAAYLEEWLSGQSAAARAFDERYGGTIQGALDAGQSDRLRSLGYLD